MSLDNQFEHWKTLRSLSNTVRILSGQKKEDTLNKFYELSIKYQEKYNEEFNYSVNPIRKIQ